MIFVHLLSQNIRPDLSQSAFLAIACCVSAHTAIQVSSYVICCIQFCTCCHAGYPEFSKIVVGCLLHGRWLHLTFLGYVIMSELYIKSYLVRQPSHCQLWILVHPLHCQLWILVYAICKFVLFCFYQRGWTLAKMSFCLLQNKKQTTWEVFIDWFSGWDFFHFVLSWFSVMFGSLFHCLLLTLSCLFSLAEGCLLYL